MKDLPEEQTSESESEPSQDESVVRTPTPVVHFAQRMNEQFGTNVWQQNQDRAVLLDSRFTSWVNTQQLQPGQRTVAKMDQFLSLDEVQKSINTA